MKIQIFLLRYKMHMKMHVSAKSWILWCFVDAKYELAREHLTRKVFIFRLPPTVWAANLGEYLEWQSLFEKILYLPLFVSRFALKYTLITLSVVIVEFCQRYESPNFAFFIKVKILFYLNFILFDSYLEFWELYF